MTFLPLTPHENLDADSLAMSDRHEHAWGTSLPTMRATLIGHEPSFNAYMQWYILKDELVPFIGERAVSLFAYAISEAHNCLACSTHFRKVLTDSGEDVDNPQVTDAESLLMNWGRMIARAPNEIPQEMYDRLEATFQPRLRLILVAFAGQTVAMNLLNTVGRIPLDEELMDFRAPGDSRTQ
jgi:hypothetical protein